MDAKKSAAQPTPQSQGVNEARKAMEFLQSSGLVNLEQPLRNVIGSVSKLEQVAGYVIAWERYVLVVARADMEAVVNPATKSQM